MSCSFQRSANGIQWTQIGTGVSDSNGYAYLTEYTEHQTCFAYYRVVFYWDSLVASSPFTIQWLATITPHAGPGGSIVPSTPVTLQGGESVTFRFIADNGHAVDQVYIDGVSYPWQEPSYTFENVRSSHTINVTFNQNVPSLKGIPVVGSYWVGYFNEHSPTVRGVMAFIQVVVNQGAPSSWVWVELKSQIENDTHVHLVTADVVSEDPASPFARNVMIRGGTKPIMFRGTRQRNFLISCF